MNAFGFQGRHRLGVSYASGDAGGYRVGVLVNDNTGSSRGQLTIDGVPVGARLLNEYCARSSRTRVAARTGSRRRQHHHRGRDRCAARRSPAARARAARGHGHGTDGTDVVRSAAAISSSRSRRRASSNAPPILPSPRRASPSLKTRTRSTRYTPLPRRRRKAAIYDALFEAKTMTGRNGKTVYALPVDRVLEMLQAAHAIAQ